ncbi:MAG: hypothetical protein AAFU85_14015 [Planctomycetota bacterium]
MSSGSVRLAYSSRRSKPMTIAMHRKYSLRLFLLCCLLLAMLMAWGSHLSRDDRFATGFSSSESRPLAFVAAGELEHSITREVRHEPTDERIRIVTRIRLKHDRVLSRSIETCVERLAYENHSRGNSLEFIDKAFIEEYAMSQLEYANGSSCVESVSVESIQYFAGPNTDPSEISDSAPNIP